MIKIFIVDDHYMVVEGIQSLLVNEKDIEFIGSASTAESCRAFLKQKQPDVLLMDISLPDGNGIELCKEVREKYPRVFVLGLSTFNQESFIRKMLDNGASGYVLKNATRKELKDAIIEVNNGKTYLAFEAAKTMRLGKSHQAGNIVIGRREKEVLELLANGQTNIEIAAELAISTNTVDTYRRSLLSKLNAKNTPELIKLAFVYKLISLDQ
jgi:DNA-binding NarL/FixJ family response regulator